MANNNIGPPVAIPEFNIENWMPMEPAKGPPLPRFLGIYWPWYKPELPPLPPTIYTCPYCLAQFSTEVELLAHIESEHPGEVPVVYYTCPICAATFIDQEELYAHILAEHPEVIPEVPPEEIAAKIISINWELIDYTFVGYWPEETGPLKAVFCKGTLQVESISNFVGSVKITCPNTIAPVRLLTAYGYQKMIAEIDALIAGSTDAIQQLWINRKEIALTFPKVDEFTIDYRWLADFDRSFRDWVYGDPIETFILNNVSIPKGTSTVKIGFFAKYGAAVGVHPAVVRLYSDENILDTIETDLVPPGTVPQLLGISLPESVSSGGNVPVNLVLRLPPQTNLDYYFGLTVRYAGKEGTIARASYAPTAMVNTWLGRGCTPFYLPLNAPDNIYTIKGILVAGAWTLGKAEYEVWRPRWAGGTYYVPLPKGVYPVYLRGESWKISVPSTGCGIDYWGYDAAARYDFGIVGHLVVT